MFLSEMAPVKLKYIVSFSSQDDCHKANNLITGGGTKKWLCHPKDRNGKIVAVIQLEEATQFAFIDIGTMWCASLEIRVGNSDWPQTMEYKTLVPRVTLMSPIDCQLGRKTTNTQMFTSKDFSNTVIGQKWDRIQVICCQPYRKDVQLGISFIRVRNSGQASLNCSIATKEDTYNKKKSPQGKKVTDIKRHFFGESKENKGLDEEQLKQRLLQISSSSDNACENLHEESLSRTAQLVLKASEKTNKSSSHYTMLSNQCKRGLFSDTKTCKTGLTLEEEMAAFLPTLNLSMVDLDTVTVADLRHKFERKKKRKLSPQERRKFSEQCQSFMWQLSENGFSNESKKSSMNAKLPSAGSVETITSQPVQTSKKQDRGAEVTNDPSTNPAFRSPPSMKSSSNSTSNGRNWSKAKLSPAAIMRANNCALDKDLIQLRKSNLKHNGKSNESHDKTCNSSSSSDSDTTEDSNSDICYNDSSCSSSSGSDCNNFEIDDSSPNSKIHIKRKLQTLDDVNRSYQDLYNTFSTTSEKSDNDCSSSNSSAKRKKLNSNNKKLLEVFDSELSDNEPEKGSRGHNSSNSTGWLNANKKAEAVTPKAVKQKKRVTPSASNNNSFTNTTKSKSPSVAISKKKVSSSAKKSSPAALKGTATPDPTKCESFKTFNWPSKSSASIQKGNVEQDALRKHVLRKVNSGSSSMLCKSCGFLIPQDTYAAHCSTCITPAKTDIKQTNSASRNGENVGSTTKTINSTPAGSNSKSKKDVILTQPRFSQCPICLHNYPQDILMVHASECGL